MRPGPPGPDPAAAAAQAAGAARAARAFRAAPLRDRLHVAVRRRLFPFQALLGRLPAVGEAVDIGCGHGLWPLMMGQARPGLEVLGVDPDGDKIARARAAAAAAGAGNVRFAVGRAEELRPAGADLISLIDVLYLLGPAQQEAVLRAAVAGLRPGGRLLVKEMSERPRWKALWNRAQEQLSVRLLGVSWSDGRAFCFRQEAQWRALLEGLGLRVTLTRLDAGYLHPHLLIEGATAA